ncbi:hypothetical protein [Roseovarius sp. D22-M7]|uniref:hypothetical protein n=1 Tax=Roseovarius sp. D22-M7 TaxID=3127116 RepID=UPI0030103F73
MAADAWQTIAIHALIRINDFVTRFRKIIEIAILWSRQIGANCRRTRSGKSEGPKIHAIDFERANARPPVQGQKLRLRMKVMQTTKSTNPSKNPTVVNYGA